VHEQRLAQQVGSPDCSLAVTAAAASCAASSTRYRPSATLASSASSRATTAALTPVVSPRRPGEVVAARAVGAQTSEQLLDE
jgi:hypothetical protein